VNNVTPEWPILRLYELISGPADCEREWDEIGRLFMPAARLRMAPGQDDEAEPGRDWSVEEFAEAAAPYYRQAGFWEREIGRRVERYGNIAHVFSTYESRVGSPDSEPVSRGINSVQVIFRDGRWNIAGIVFQRERSGAPIPSRYLQSGDSGTNGGGVV
jgi:hypothetical protein